MPRIKPHEYDPETWDDEDEFITFEPVQNKAARTPTLKDERRREAREWGRSMNKFHKQRTKHNLKP